MEFTIDRVKWLRGEGNRNSKLIRSTDGKMCCLGFFGLACGIPAKLMVDVGAPDDMEVAKVWEENQQAKILLDTFHSGATWDGAKMMNINDDQNISGHQREKELSIVFARNGITVKFEGEG